MTRFLHSFAHAYDGIVDAARVQRNFAIHLVIAAGVLVAALALHVALWPFVALLAFVALVLGLELANTAIEALVDLAMPSEHPLAKRAKDAAAGAVLAASFAAVLAGGAIFAEATRAGYRRPAAPALDVQTVTATVAVFALLCVLGRALWRARLGVFASLLLVLLSALASCCLCLLAHDARML